MTTTEHGALDAAKKQEHDARFALIIDLGPVAIAAIAWWMGRREYRRLVAAAELEKSVAEADAWIEETAAKGDVVDDATVPVEASTDVVLDG